MNRPAQTRYQSTPQSLLEARGQYGCPSTAKGCFRGQAEISWEKKPADSSKMTQPGRTLRLNLRGAFLVRLFLDGRRGFFHPLFVIAREPLNTVGPHPQH